MRLALAAAVIAVAGFVSGASYGQNVPCDQFVKHPDGSWSPLKPMTLKHDGMEVGISPAVSFRPGVAFDGVDLATLLNQSCQGQSPGFGGRGAAGRSGS